MKNIGSKEWKKIADMIGSGLGRSRVRSDELAITMKFNLCDPAEMAQFQHFGSVALDNKLKFTTHPISKMDIEVSFALNNDPVALVRIAESMAVRTFPTDNGEIHRRITPIDPEYILQDLTGVPWDHVSKSRYRTEVVEAVLPEPVDAETRTRQEFGVGNALKADGTITLEVKNWLEHQKEVEEADKIPPATALPRDWVSTSGVGRAERIKHTSLGEALPKLFRR